MWHTKGDRLGAMPHITDLNSSILIKPSVPGSLRHSDVMLLYKERSEFGHIMLPVALGPSRHEHSPCHIPHQVFGTRHWSGPE